MTALSTIAVDTSVGSSEWLKGARRARRLASISLAWLCFEGAATTTAGLLAADVRPRTISTLTERLRHAQRRFGSVTPYELEGMVDEVAG